MTLAIEFNGNQIAFDSQKVAFGCEKRCSYCNVGTTPSQILVEIYGITNDHCSECDSLNGSFVLDQSAWDACLWRYVQSPELCTDPIYGKYNRLDVIMSGGYLTVNWCGYAITYIWWSKVLSGSFDCNLLDESDIPFDDSFYSQCNVTAPPTCRITAIP